jgi:murein DD-endopeptidase MepM/ murein hydrolase activator NlpD
VNRPVFKLFVTLLIGFATILIFSRLTAQNVALQRQIVEFQYPGDEINPSDSLYDGMWFHDQIRYDWRDSIRKMVIDTSFFQLVHLKGIDVGTFVPPIEGRVTSRFGPRRYRHHNGIDINLNTGDTVLAAFDGRVRIAAYFSGYGYTVVIRHYNGLETLYGHFSKILVDTNQLVMAGEPIGLGGNTGRSYGSHLHFEVRYLGIAFNPELIINFDENRLLSDTLMLTAAHFRHLGGASGGSAVANASYHRVRSGDNLSTIARRYGTSVNNLCQLNNISRTTTLQIGRTLRVR